MESFSQAVSIIKEAAKGTLHPDAVHYGPHEGNHKQFKIHKVGSNFSDHVSAGDVVKSSAIDDLADAGAKLKLVKPKLAESVEQVEEANVGDHVRINHGGKSVHGVVRKKQDGKLVIDPKDTADTSTYRVPNHPDHVEVVKQSSLKESANAEAAYRAAHDELGEHIAQLVAIHKATHPNKLAASRHYIGRKIHWGHVGTLADANHKLKDVVDSHNGTGEYA